MKNGLFYTHKFIVSFSTTDAGHLQSSIFLNVSTRKFPNTRCYGSRANATMEMDEKSSEVEKVMDKNEEAATSPAKPKKRTIKLSSITNSEEKEDNNKFMDNYLQNLSYGYNTLLYVFQYLKVQDLLRAGCVCTMWRDIASHPMLWRTVRMKNSQVHSFQGLANSLKTHGTRHLDLRKMLLPNGGDEILPEFSKAIEKVDTLRKIYS